MMGSVTSEKSGGLILMVYDGHTVITQTTLQPEHQVLTYHIGIPIQLVREWYTAGLHMVLLLDERLHEYIRNQSCQWDQVLQRC